MIIANLYANIYDKNMILEWVDNDGNENVETFSVDDKESTLNFNNCIKINNITGCNFMVPDGHDKEHYDLLQQFADNAEENFSMEYQNQKFKMESIVLN